MNWTVIFWFAVGFGLGGSTVGVILNHRFIKTLTTVEREVQKLVAYHDEVVRGLIAANDGGRRKRDPLS